MSHKCIKDEYGLCFECDKPMTTNDRVKKHRLEQGKLNRKRREFYLTEKEKKKVDEYILKLRA